MFKRSKYDLLEVPSKLPVDDSGFIGEQIVHLKLHSDLIPLFTKGFLDPSMSHDTKSKSLFISVNHLGLSTWARMHLILEDGTLCTSSFLLEDYH